MKVYFIINKLIFYKYKIELLYMSFGKNPKFYFAVTKISLFFLIVTD